MGSPCVLATIVWTEGSTYQKAGTQLCIRNDNSPLGILGGACVDAKILETARSVFENRKTQILHIDSSQKEDAIFGYGSGCAGKQNILLQFKNDIPEQQSAEHIQAFVLGPSPFVGQSLVLNSSGVSEISIAEPFVQSLIQLAQETLQQQTNRRVSVVVDETSLDVVFIFRKAQPHLHIMGAGADAHPLYRFAHELGWKVSLYDHRNARLVSDLYPDANLHAHYDIQAKAHPSIPQAVVLMTHNFMTDLMVLEKICEWNSWNYLGLLGPKRRGEQLLDHVRGRELLTSKEGIYYPVGLTLGGRSPSEIALATIAEILAVINAKNVSHFREIA